MVELEGVGVGKGDGEYREKLLCVKTCKDLWKRDESGEKLKDRDGNVDRGRYLRQVQQHLWEERVQGARHLEDAGCQSHNADLKSAIIQSGIPDKLITYLVTLACQQTIFKTLDQLLLQILLQAPVVAGQGSQHRVHGGLELRPAKL